MFRVLVGMGCYVVVFTGRPKYPGLSGELSALRRSGLWITPLTRVISQSLFLHTTHLQCLLKRQISGLFSA